MVFPAASLISYSTVLVPSPDVSVQVLDEAGASQELQEPGEFLYRTVWTPDRLSAQPSVSTTV